MTQAVEFRRRFRARGPGETCLNCAHNRQGINVYWPRVGSGHRLLQVTMTACFRANMPVHGPFDLPQPPPDFWCSWHAPGGTPCHPVIADGEIVVFGPNTPLLADEARLAAFLQREIVSRDRGFPPWPFCDSLGRYVTLPALDALEILLPPQTRRRLEPEPLVSELPSSPAEPDQMPQPAA